MLQLYIKPIFICWLIGLAVPVYAQDRPSTPLKSATSANDTSRVTLLLNLSRKAQPSNPDSALIYAQQALTIARNTGNIVGEANSLNRAGVVLWKNGKYDRALHFLINSLKIREKNDDLRGQVASLNNIGILYSDQNDNKKALFYHFKAKAIAESLQDRKLLSIVLSNIGNCYIKLNNIGSALAFEMRAYQLQQGLGDQAMLPSTLSILGDVHYKMNHEALALDYYRLSAAYAMQQNDQSNLADTYNSMALLYKNNGRKDSCLFYAKKALKAGQIAKYPVAIYNAGNLLTQMYQGRNERKELMYLKAAMAAKDSMFNIEKVKQVQILSFNEAARQEEIIDEKRRESEERIINLQLIGIAIFIPTLFLILLLLSKSRTHRKVIEFMSVICLLLVFEFISLFIHPFIQSISNHLPVLELLILVLVAAILVPSHHKLTEWMRDKLAHAPKPQKSLDTEKIQVDAE
ncbi:tetratricopeptide repeat protein [Mucilaginibacter sp.]|jgi:tetratricopeptide (TPR) repeat protein|uniref:tetratricopeptide repeat protein n=1 Tax=Mucilaginibacter sp. TaxID=1882438 RepID=UPI00356154BC